ncbi:hypothetical protein [Streptomyces abikoensis]|uniref:hypothetical protein n=1 Tax=Streptomyces abikoensis TaxID=97398 RepID=UPI0019C65881|nr:hypothetical protein [Streptomyces abikoensis]GGP71528.1 hypothetical protein GCM10010214_53000 [Streptomyces abikoensis]
MPYRIGLVLQRTLSLVLNLLFPATGARRRAAAAPSPYEPYDSCRSGTGTANPTAPRPRTASGLRLLIQALTPPSLPGAPDRCAARADLTPFFRPHRLTHEQRRRRTALALALDGIDVGPWAIHGHRIGTPAVALAPQAVAA